MAIVIYKDKEFNNNPNDLPESTQFKGDIYIKFAGHSCMTVYGITRKQVMEQVEKFKEIEPKTGVVEIYGPENTMSTIPIRDYVDTVVLF